MILKYLQCFLQVFSFYSVNRLIVAFHSLVLFGLESFAISSIDGDQKLQKNAVNCIFPFRKIISAFRGCSFTVQFCQHVINNKYGFSKAINNQVNIFIIKKHVQLTNMLLSNIVFVNVYSGFSNIHDLVICYNDDFRSYIKRIVFRMNYNFELEL